jgi:hypothetical protein
MRLQRGCSVAGYGSDMLENFVLPRVATREVQRRRDSTMMFGVSKSEGERELRYALPCRRAVMHTILSSPKSG